MSSTHRTSGNYVEGERRSECPILVLVLSVVGQMSEALPGWRAQQLNSCSVRPEPLGEVHGLSLSVCLLPEFLQESSRGTVLEVPSPGETPRTFPLPCQYCEFALGCRSHRLPCSYNSWISWQFFTTLPKHLNVNLRCSTVCLKWLIKIRTKPLLCRVVKV